MAERVQKVMARLGIASRRFSEEMIEEGRVTINGGLAILGDKIEDTDELSIDGVVYSHAPDRVTFLLNKPAQVISASEDDRGRKTVCDLIDSQERLFPVGRLDYETEGLILITNDGDLTYRCTHPKFGLRKTYLAEVEGELTAQDLRKLREGIELDDGLTSPASASQPEPGLLKLTIHEGRNRQVRRMCDAVGHPCKRLVRTHYGPLTMGKLGPGEYRQLSQDDLLDLARAIEAPETLE